MDTAGELILIRHGETEWSRSGRHTGRTDVALTALGEEQASALIPYLDARNVVHALVSPASRARRTAQLAGVVGVEIEADLWEWDYGGYEGRTSREIRHEHPGWYLWTDGIIPGDDAHPGESIQQVGARVDAVLDRVQILLDDGDVLVVAHGHVLRVLTARWLGLEPAAGRLFRLDTGKVSVLGKEHDRAVIAAWNIPPVV
ncbi:histidine phosphatase family protein [Phytoactinopolyspora mesophila]|uniref:Histidine phosphatase family protein n=1 Tax=Phytoactinopolyspora mesophila TaxID=2650750 RepID=A0A7K3LYV8_9ACTN|nr:histidine phosphatase family protein [Phytoactinopolyspora mesophila]NDL56189.1 histidine phosphatase family protein [Phytoactinopolyspora mesophila]